MTDPAERALALLTALGRLPPVTALVFHGLDSLPDLTRPLWTVGLVATSRDPRVATENFTTPAIAAIVSRSGRDITAVSAHPDEREIVIPPQSVLREVTRITGPDGRTPVAVIEQLAEIDPDSGLPSTLDGLIGLVQSTLAASHADEPVAVTTPGKFIEPLHFAATGE